MHNPLRSEADAFRFVMTIGAGAAAVIALSLLAGPRFGVVLAAALVGFAAGVAWARLRAPSATSGPAPSEEAGPEDATR